MADSDGKVKIIIDTNAQEATKELNNVGSAFKKNADVIQKSSTVYQGYEKAIKDNVEVLRELALGGNQNTAGFKQLADKTREYKKALDEANQAVEKSIGGLERQSSPLNGLTSKLKGLIGAYIGIQGAQMLFNKSMEAVEAFRTQERAIASLNTALANAGVYSEKYSKHIQTLASEIQRYSNYGDEVIIKAQALGQSFIGQTKITDELTKATVDFAAATGMDLEQAFTLVGKSIGSPTNALARYGVQLNKNMSDQQKMIAITAQLGSRYEGQAKQMANASTQLKNAVGDLAESFGKALDPAVKNTQNSLLSGVNALNAWINKVRVLNTDINNLTDEAELRQRYYKNIQRMNKAVDNENSVFQKMQDNTGMWKQEQRRLQAENNQILGRISLLKQQRAEQEKLQKSKKPFKVTDIEGFTTTQTSTKSSGGGTAQTQAKQIKDSYDLATEAVEKARRAVLNAGLQYGTSSEQVKNAFTQYKLASEKLTNIEGIFKTEETKTALQTLQDQITKTTEKLKNMYLTGQGNSETFKNLKNDLVQMQTELQNANTAVSSKIGVDWQIVSDSIKSSLSSAILTPLQQGESAFDRLGKIGLNVVQMIGQQIISDLLKQITLEKTIQAIKGIGSKLGFGGMAMSMVGAIAKNGKVFRNGNVVPFARGGIVNKPTLFPMKNGGTGLMGEAGAEAVMPLTRKNGKLGVEASGGGTVVNIYNQSGANIETRQRQDGGIDVIVQRVNEALMNERTSSGFRAAYQREDRKGVQAC